MKSFAKLISVILFVAFANIESFSQGGGNDTTLVYPFDDNSGLIYDTTQFSSPLMMEAPEGAISEEVVYDPVTGEYVLKQTVNGKVDYRPPVRMTLQEYSDYDFSKAEQNYWSDRARNENFENQGGLIPKLYIGGKLFETIFGSNTIDIKVRGQAMLTFGVQYDKTDNPSLPIHMRRSTTFQFDQQIQVNVDGKIGENLELQIKYDTQGSFDFENKTNIKYQSNEDDIIQRIEAGDVSLPLTGSLIRGSQSLFGILTELKFGKLNVTTLFSQKRSESKTIEVQGGAQKTEFKIGADEYDENRHYFVSHTFRDGYQSSLANLPVIQSGAIIQTIEVWVLNKSGTVDNTRNIVAFMDLAEGNSQNLQNRNINTRSGISDNNSNDLYATVRGVDIRNIATAASALSTLESQGYRIGRDYEIVENARKLTTNEYQLNATLGYISLNTQLKSDEILAVAYKYDYGGKPYSVGELSSDLEVPNTLIVKLLKGTSFTPLYKNWGLMMKNVYRLGGYQINNEEFLLDIVYNDVKTGREVYSIAVAGYPNIDGVQLLRVMNMDNLDQQNYRVSEGDGVFDFVNGVTIDAQRGLIYFPVLEPFGRHLQSKFGSQSNQGAMAEAQKYIFLELYDSTKTVAKQISEKNKFRIQGEYKSAGGSEISLNAMNIPRGSVSVTHAGAVLVEDQDYTVDYMMGRLTIIKPGVLESGTPVQISLENNSLFTINQKTLMGAHVTYDTGPKFNISGTIMNMRETPLTTKVNIGSEPINNTIWGFNLSYKTEAPFLTKLVDKLPLLSTKAPSSISVEGEFAHLIPGHNKVIDKEGKAFIDDFEGATSTIDLRQPTTWGIASTPLLFPEGLAGLNDLNYRGNAAHLSWYVIDPLFYASGAPVSKDAISDLHAAQFMENQLFPNIDNAQSLYNTLSILNLAYYPKERGAYNYIYENLNSDGDLQNPERNWGGIQRALTVSDFESLNVEFVEFWLMDPYAEDEANGVTRQAQNPSLYINLGDINEDILKDGRRSFEQGLPKSPEIINVDTTRWGRVSTLQTITNSFDNGDPASRQYQDAGLDGMGDGDERDFFSELFANIPSVPEEVRARIMDDPSGDNFRYFRGDDLDNSPVTSDNVLERYKYYSGLQNNSPINSSNVAFTPQSTSMPDSEDANGDYTLNQSENYFQYQIDLSKENLEYNRKNIVDEITVNMTMPNGASKSIKWYQFKIPVRNPDEVVGEISDYRSIRFMRMFLTGFDENIVLRFAKLGLVRSEWRRYEYVLEENGESLNPNINLDETAFEVFAVNIEENSSRTPVNYLLPPDVDRELINGGTQTSQMNEQSLSMRVVDLPDGYAKAVYKNIDMDMRRYGKIKMYVHAEALEDLGSLTDEDVTVFMRIGTDFKENYYEYEVPLSVTPPDRYPDNTWGRQQIWPTNNNVDIELQAFVDAKNNRNIAMTESGSSITYQTEYISQQGNNRVKVCGNPSLSEVKSIMIGIRNPRNDNVAKSVEVWINELALTNFAEEGGWAATARLTAQLADFANVTIAGNTSSNGFGSIDQRLNERQKENVKQYDISTNVELGKFFPNNANVRLPMYFGYSEEFITPEFNPLDQDVLFETSLDNPNLSNTEKDYIRNISQEYTRRKSLNFTNIKVGKPAAQPKFYSVSNWTAGYSFTDVFMSGPSTEYHSQHRHVGTLGYVFNNTAKIYEPLKNVKFLSAKPLAIVKDINFSLMPNQLSFTTQIERQYNEMLRRNLNNPNQTFNPSYNKDFRWTRNYQLSYNLTRGIKIDFTSNALARIEEPEGRLDRDMEDYRIRRDSIISSIKNFGTTTDYSHNIRVSYNIPINKLPGLDWTQANAGYTGQYNWNIGAQMQNDSLDYGNNIQNSNTKQLNLGANINRLMLKSGYINDIHKKFKKPVNERFKEKEVRTVRYKRENLRFRANEARKISHRLSTEDITVMLTDDKGQKVNHTMTVETPDRVAITPDKDITGGSITITGKVEHNQTPLRIASEYFVRIITGLQNINYSYTGSRGTSLGGYNQKASFLGSNANFNNFAPGWGYLAGITDDEYVRDVIIRNNWMSTNITETILNFYTVTERTNMTLKATFEPVSDMQIMVDWMYNSGSTTPTQYYAVNGVVDQQGQPTMSGNYSISYSSYRTAFKKIDKKTFSNEAFENFLKYRSQVAWQIARMRSEKVKTYSPGTGIYPEGYSESHPDVLMYAFQAAYAGTNPDKYIKGPGKLIPSFLSAAPGWRIDYKGLTKIPFFSRYFRTVTLTHTYASNFTVGAFQTNPEYNNESTSVIGGYSDMLSIEGTYYVPEYLTTSVSFQESFGPLAGINFTWKNGVNTGFNYKKDRNVALNLTNNTLTEIHNWEISIRSGYTIKEVPLVIKTSGISKKFVSNVNIQGNFSIRNGVTYNRQISLNVTERIAGNINYAFKLSADYQFSTNLNVQAFYEHTVNKPWVSTAFRTVRAKFGITLNYRLTE